MNGKKGYAYKSNDQHGLDLESIAETPELVRDRYLRESMGWQFDYPERYNQDEEWERVLNYGQVVKVLIMEE